MACLQTHRGEAGGRLSLQLHHHRAQYWVVNARDVAIGDKVQMLQENESIYVPIGWWHRLDNPDKIDLELIEVQIGSYLNEDDIPRICRSQTKPTATAEGRVLSARSILQGQSSIRQQGMCLAP